MKGFNIKKLATIAAGAALVGSAVAPIAAAALTDLTKSDVVDATGAPVVDIVVGARAAISDVVWAGNIAARLAQLATKTATVTGGSGIGAPDVKDLKVKVSVGGTTTVSGGKTFFSDMNSATNATAEYSDQNVTQSNVPSLKYYGNKTYTWNNTSYSTTMQEKLNFTVDVSYDKETAKTTTGKILQGQLKYTVDLGSGIPYTEATGSATAFADDKNDNILVPFFGKDYLVKSVSNSSGYVELVETSGEKDYRDGDKIEAVKDTNGNTYYIKVGPGAVSGTTNKIKLDIYDSTDTRIDGGYYSSGDVYFYKSGQTFLQTSINISDILKATVSQSDVFTATIYIGTSRLQLYDSKGYPYDASKASDDYDYTASLVWDTAADKNKLLRIEIVNSARKVWNAATAITIGQSVDYANNVGKLKFVGLQLPGTSGVTKTERTTGATIGGGKLTYKDVTYEANHDVPFYVYIGELSNAGTSTFSVDTKTIFAAASTTDKNIWASNSTGGRVSVPDQNQCIGDGNYINGQKINITDVNASGAFIASLGGLLDIDVGTYVDLNGIQFKLSGWADPANCVYLLADGNVTFRKDGSSGTLIQEFWYTDENAATTAKIALAGASDITHNYTPMVDERTSVARIWMFLSDQNFVTQYNKRIDFLSTDTAETFTRAVPFYLPMKTELPDDYNGGGNYSSSQVNVAEFRIEEDGETAASARDYNILIDTLNGNAVNTANTNLDSASPYKRAAINHTPNGVGAGVSVLFWGMSEESAKALPTDAYSDFGSHSTLSSGVFSIVIPENKPQIEVLLSGTGTTTTTTGGEDLEIAKGATGTTTSGTTIEVKDVTYTATCAAGAGACTPSSYEQVVSVGKLVYTDDSPPTGKVIIVGGHLVNALAQGITDDKLVAAGDKVAEKQASGDIVVAGYTAADTGSAAQELIDALDALLG